MASLKEIANLRLGSPENIKIPMKYNENIEDIVFFGEIKSNLSQIYRILNSTLEIIELDDDYITDSNDLLIAKKTLTITLNANPLDQEKVQIKNIGGITTIKGNNKLIDGCDKLIINNKYDAPTLIYIESVDQWFIF
jgi:hypothetical protein